jgi:peptidoglycan/xylan/chitin deacetylase (PgdA/CDA1 family)
MYHYVRDMNLKENKGYNGLDISKFITQLDYLKKKYEIINIKNLFDINFLKKKINKKYCLLTFDDGYSDHYDNVLPILLNKKVSGSFYVSAKTIVEKKALSANKLHYILSKIKTNEIIKIIKKFLIEVKFKNSFENISKIIKNTSRFDDDDTNFIKNFFKNFLSSSLQNQLHRIIFQSILRENEEEIFKDFYLSKKKIYEMQKYGMYFGGHGYDHQRLDLIEESEQLIEIDKTIKFLKEINTDTQKWVMCYPYGGYNNLLIEKLKAKNCFIGLTTKPKIANVKKYSLLTLPRFDANDFLNLS